MSGTVDKLSSLFSGNVFVGLVFEFDEFSDADNGRVASWIEENRESFIFKAEPTVSLPQVGDRFEIDGDFALEIRKRVFRVYGEAEPSILLQCAVIDESPCDVVKNSVTDVVLDPEELRVKELLEKDIFDDIMKVSQTEYYRYRSLYNFTFLCNVLEKNGFRTYADLLQCGRPQLMRIRGLGRCSLRILERLLEMKGLEFGMDLKKYGIKPGKIL